MSLKHLKLPDDVERVTPKTLTPFQRKRKEAKTYEELVYLGYAEGFNNPEEWADRVIQARDRF